MRLSNLEYFDERRCGRSGGLVLLPLELSHLLDQVLPVKQTRRKQISTKSNGELNHSNHQHSRTDLPRLLALVLPGGDLGGHVVQLCLRVAQRELLPEGRQRGKLGGGHDVVLPPTDHGWTEGRCFFHIGPNSSSMSASVFAVNIFCLFFVSLHLRRGLGLSG